MPLCVCANDGNADLFCCLEIDTSATFVLTRSPSGRPPAWNPADGGVVLKLPEPELMPLSCVRFAEMRASSELETSFGSLFVLDERARPSTFVGGGTPSVLGGPPAEGSSVWMKQHLLPYGHDPDTQNVCDKAEVSDPFIRCALQRPTALRMRTRTLQISVLYCGKTHET